MKIRILLSSGGTGGHIFPAIAVAEQIRLLEPSAELLFVGSNKGPERLAAEVAKIPFEGLPVEGILGKGLRSVKAVACMLHSTVKALGIIRRFRPDIALGFGAYTTVPPLLAARFYNVPIALHEQNAMPGLSNRLLSRIAARIFTSLEAANEYFPPNKIILTGNPVRASIIALGNQPLPSRDGKRLFIMGGSQGAHAINSLIIANLERLAKANIQLSHQTGLRDYERVHAAYQARGINTETVVPFIDDMPRAYANADFVLGRAGASSVAELAASGTPSLLIPFPAATHDHQTHNAAALVSAGAALMIPEKDIAHHDVTHTLITLLNDPITLQRMGQLAHQCAHPDAAALVAKEILAICALKRSGNKEAA